MVPDALNLREKEREHTNKLLTKTYIVISVCTLMGLVLMHPDWAGQYMPAGIKWVAFVAILIAAVALVPSTIREAVAMEVEPAVNPLEKFTSELKVMGGGTRGYSHKKQ